MRGCHEGATCIPELAELLGMWEMRKGMRPLRRQGHEPSSRFQLQTEVLMFTVWSEQVLWKRCLHSIPFHSILFDPEAPQNLYQISNSQILILRSPPQPTLPMTFVDVNDTFILPATLVSFQAECSFPPSLHFSHPYYKTTLDFLLVVSLSL